jgi:hypothetical protein
MFVGLVPISAALRACGGRGCRSTVICAARRGFRLRPCPRWKSTRAMQPPSGGRRLAHRRELSLRSSCPGVPGGSDRHPDAGLHLHSSWQEEKNHAERPLLRPIQRHPGRMHGRCRICRSDWRRVRGIATQRQLVQIVLLGDRRIHAGFRPSKIGRLTSPASMSGHRSAPNKNAPGLPAAARNSSTLTLPRPAHVPPSGSVF